MQPQPEAKLRDWMLTTMSNGGVERLDDLRVDAIDQSWKPRTTWTAAAFKAFEIALELRHELQVDATVALASHYWMVLARSSIQQKNLMLKWTGLRLRVDFAVKFLHLWSLLVVLGEGKSHATNKIFPLMPCSASA